MTTMMKMKTMTAMMLTMKISTISADYYYRPFLFIHEEHNMSDMSSGTLFPRNNALCVPVNNGYINCTTSCRIIL